MRVRTERVQRKTAGLNRIDTDNKHAQQREYHHKEYRARQRETALARARRVRVIRVTARC
jgi:hypothetical protein